MVWLVDEKLIDEECERECECECKCNARRKARDKEESALPSSMGAMKLKNHIAKAMNKSNYKAMECLNELCSRAKW